MRLDLQSLKRKFLILSWALYDLANQFFALNIVSLYFVRWLTLERKTPEVFYSISFGISSFLVGILAPIAGAVSDLTKRRRIFLVSLTLSSIIFTIALGLTRNTFLALLFFAIANFGCQMATVFYNASILNITTQDKVGLVSGFGRMTGYAGAILALYIFKPIVLKSGYQATFIPTGILFLIFALPCMFFIKDEPNTVRLPEAIIKNWKVKEIFKTLKTALFNTRRLPAVSNFLKAAFFGLCAVNTVILFMSVFASRVFGLNESQITNLIALSTLFAMAGSIFSGAISDYFGYKRSLIAVFAIWAACFLLAAFARSAYLYWITGALVGIALSATWVVSRALCIKLIPPESVGELFGLFNFAGYLSSIVGALFWGIVIYFLAPFGEWGYRMTLLSLILFIALGFVFLLRLPEEKK